MGVITKTSTRAWRATTKGPVGDQSKAQRPPHFSVRDGLGVQESYLETLAKSLQQMSEDGEATSHETHSREQPGSANLSKEEYWAFGKLAGVHMSASASSTHQRIVCI
jgi:hypothetical protein